MKKYRMALLLIACMAFVFSFTCLFTSCNRVSVREESIQAFNKSEGLWYQYKLKEAKEGLEEILKKDPDYAEANRKMAFIEYYYYQNYDKALEYVEKALEKEPGEVQNHLLSGGIYFAKGQYEKALTGYKKALELDSKNTDIHYSIAQSYMRLNKDSEVKEILEKGNIINPFEVRINTALHLQYVKDGEYEKAYDIWEKGNACDTNPIGYFREWNELYKDALKSNTASMHSRFGDLYTKLLLYDEAKLELEKALKNDPNNNDISRKLNEISLFVKFRDDMKECFDSYHRKRIVNGIIEEKYLQNDVENIYKQMLVLFPDIEYTPLSFQNYRKYTLNNEIQKKFNVIIDYFPVDGFFGCYFWYVVSDSNEKISHWGKEAHMRVTIVKNAVVNSFWSWYHNMDGTGGWSLSSLDENNEMIYENKIALDSKFKMAYDLWKAATNQEKRKEFIAKAEGSDKDLIKKPSLEVFYSSLLSAQCGLKAMDELIEKAKTKLDSEEEIKSYAIGHIVYDAYVPLTYIHEGQHIIDATHYNYGEWEREYRAMMSELVYGKMQLQDITSMMHPDIGDKSTAYGIAHTKIFTDIVNYINDHRSDYPVINTDKNIMMQLSKLGSNDLKEIAKNIFEKVYPDAKYE